MNRSYCVFLICSLFCLPSCLSARDDSADSSGFFYKAETYRFPHAMPALSVCLFPYPVANAAAVGWTQAGTRHRQTLSLPKGWWPTTYASTDQLPGVVVWQVGREHLLILAAQCESGVYGYRCPLIYRFSQKQWRLVPSKIHKLEFSDRGSFYTHGKNVYVWDYTADPCRAHRALQQYWLRQFRWRDGQMQLVSERRTKHRYPDISETDNAENGWSIPDRVSAEYDPLREFGLRWHWWGKRRIVHDQ